MFQKGSFSIPSDSSGVLLVKIIQTRRCSTRKHAGVGAFLKVVLKNTKTKLTKRRKRKTKAIVIRSQRYYTKSWGLTYQFGTNSLVLLKKRMNTMGKEMYGPTSEKLRIRKFRIAFKYIYNVKFFMQFFKKVKRASVKFALNLFFLTKALSSVLKNLLNPYFFLNQRNLKIKTLADHFAPLWTKFVIISLVIFITIVLFLWILFF